MTKPIYLVVLYRSGGTKNFKWKLVSELYRPDQAPAAQAKVDELLKAGFPAIVVKQSTVKRYGLPQSFSLPAEYLPMENAGKLSKALKLALRKSEEFFGFKPRWVSKAKMTWPKSLVQLGACAQVDYISDKFDGKTRRYFHEFEGDQLPLIYAAPAPQPNGDNILIIVGKFKIEADGIIG